MSVSKNPKLQYLKQRPPGSGTWYLNLPIPREVQKAYQTASGKPLTHIVKSLGTTDREQAFRRKLTLVKRYLDEFEVHKRTLKGLPADDLMQAVAMRQTYLEAVDAGDKRKAEMVSLVITDMAEEIDILGGEDHASRRKARHFVRVAHGDKTILEAFGEWMARADLPARTRSKYETAVKEFVAFLQVENPLLDTMTRANAIKYLDWMNSEGRSQRTDKLVPLSFNTKRDRLMALSAFWNQHLSQRERMPEPTNPWSRLRPTERPTGSTVQWDSTSNTGRARERPYFDEDDLRAILDAPGPKMSSSTRYGKRTVIEVLCLGLLTGARPDEICSLRLGDIKRGKDAHWLTFDDAKNAESDRRIPVMHPLARAIVDRRINDRTQPEDQLFAEFRPKEGQQNLYELVGRAVGRHLKRATGLQAGAVPYCTRHTLQTWLGEQDVKTHVLQRYVGHAATTTMDKHYRKATDMLLLDLASKVSYPADIERRMAEELGLGTVTSPSSSPAQAAVMV